MSLGKMLVAAIGVNVSKMNPNVTFAPLGAGGQAILPVCNPPPNQTWT
jgi:hypothetical protein